MDLLVNETISQPSDWMVDQSINPSIHPALNQLNNISVSQSVRQSANQSLSLSFNELISQTINPSIHRSIHQTLSRSIHPSIHPSVIQSTNQFIDQLIDQSSYQASKQATKDPAITLVQVLYMSIEQLLSILLWKSQWDKYFKLGSPIATGKTAGTHATSCLSAIIIARDKQLGQVCRANNTSIVCSRRCTWP